MAHLKTVVSYFFRFSKFLRKNKALTGQSLPATAYAPAFKEGRKEKQSFELVRFEFSLCPRFLLGKEFTWLFQSPSHS